MKRRFVLIAFFALSLPPVTLASGMSTKLKSFQARLAKPQADLTWLHETQGILLKTFRKHPDADAALKAYIKARQSIIGPLTETCDADVDKWAAFLEEQGITPYRLLLEAFEKAARKDGQIIASVRRCLRTGLMLDHVGEGLFGFVEYPGYENAMRTKLGLPEDPVLTFLQAEYNPVVSDMSLTMSWDALRQRIIRWENFIKKLEPRKAEQYPDLGEVDWMMEVYLGKLGLDNNPIMIDGKADKEWLASLRKFAKENRTSRFIGDVDAVLKKLKDGR